MTTFTVSSTLIKRSLSGTLLALGLLLVATSSALGSTIKATLTADNKYGLFYGQADGSDLTFVGRNEFGGSGNPGLYDWSLPETFSFSASPGDYLYVLAWDGCVGVGCYSSWIGEFQLPSGVSLLSNTTDWEYAVASGANPLFGELPPLTELTTKIASATWTAPHTVGLNGTAPWGMIPGISSSAQFLDWPFSNTDSAIFRTKVAVVSALEPASVPEPSSTLSVLTFGALGVGALKRKQQQKALNCTVD